MTDTSVIADLEALGYRRVQAKRGSEQFALQATPYLVYSVHVEPDGAFLFTWELAIGELMNDRGLQVGSNDPLNVFLYPQTDARGPATADFVVGEMERAARLLGSLDLGAAS